MFGFLDAVIFFVFFFRAKVLSAPTTPAEVMSPLAVQTASPILPVVPAMPPTISPNIVASKCFVFFLFDK